MEKARRIGMAALLAVAGAMAQAVAQTASPAPSAAVTAPAVTPPAEPPAPQITPLGSLEPLVGRHVLDSEGADIGRLWDVLVDPDGHPRAVVLDYGGMLGIGRRKVAVAWQELVLPLGAADQPVKVTLSQAQLGAIPEYQYGTGSATVGATAPAP